MGKQRWMKMEGNQLVNKLLNVINTLLFENKKYGNLCVTLAWLVLTNEDLFILRIFISSNIECINWGDFPSC